MTVTPLFLEKSHMTLSFLLSPPLSLAEDSLQSDQRLLLPRLPPNIHKKVERQLLELLGKLLDRGPPTPPPRIFGSAWKCARKIRQTWERISCRRC